jgi:ATP phosphoribosyltransferase regulatory subunit
MSDLEESALLPAGLRDVLPPTAAFEAEVVERLLARVGTCGYERIKPPLVEFEQGLLSGAGAAMANETFRLMDPVSQRMMVVRADITPQDARIAASAAPSCAPSASSPRSARN